MQQLSPSANSGAGASIKILFVSTEVNPFSKVGGLGDVAGSLPQALRAAGAQVWVCMPFYGTIDDVYMKDAYEAANFTVHLSWREQPARVLAIKTDGGGILFIQNEFYFAREKNYGYGDDFERFAFFTKAAIEALSHIDFRADVIHFNDWHTGLGPVFLRDLYGGFVFYEKMKSLISIHNLHYQGVFGRDVLWNVGLDDGYFTGGELEFFGNISYLKAGIMYADAVATVSQTYAREIQTAAYGYGMDGLLRSRTAAGKKIYGITNGIDTAGNNPRTDRRIYTNFGVTDIEKKRENKHRLQEDLGLPVTDAPMFSMISRLVEQKGLDLLSIILEELLSMDVQLVVLGSGESRYENMFKHYEWRFPHRLSANITFDATLAQRIYAGSDIFLMPSVYEPCGLGQLFAMRYGTIPLVRKTGGLADTVHHYDEKTSVGNGFVFEDFVASGLMWAIHEALRIYHTPHWQQLITNAMTGEYSWARAADEYIEMYKDIIS